jgi:hypothetical protein
MFEVEEPGEIHRCDNWTTPDGLQHSDWQARNGLNDHVVVGH